jgi:penicillin-binding protein 1C
MPPDLVLKEVCSITGLPKNDYCHSTQKDQFVAGVFYKNKCSHQKKVWTTLSKSFSYCGFCLDKSNAIEQDYINYPAEYTSFLNDNGMPFERIPPHNPNCSHLNKTFDLKIISPRANSTYYIEAKQPQELALKALVSSQNTWLLWYHNNRLLGKFKASQSVFIKPVSGQNTISCTDENGKTVKINFEAIVI